MDETDHQFAHDRLAIDRARLHGCSRGVGGRRRRRRGLQSSRSGGGRTRRWLRITTICISSTLPRYSAWRRVSSSRSAGVGGPRVRRSRDDVHAADRDRLSRLPSICWCCRSVPATSQRRPSVEIAPYLPTTIRPSFTAVDQAMQRRRSIRRCTRSTARATRARRPTAGRLAVGRRSLRPTAGARARTAVVRSPATTPTRHRCRRPRTARAPRHSTGAVHAAVVRPPGDRSLAPRSPVVAAHLTATESPSTERGSP